MSRPVCRMLGLGALAALLVCAFTPLPNLVSSWLALPARIEPAGAIVVLGSSIFPDGSLSGTALRRTVYALRLYRRGLAPLLLFSGPPGSGGRPSEPAARADFARELGIPGSALLTVTAQTTREEATKVAAELRRHGVRRILLVSESQHLRRANPLFEQEGLEVLPAPADLRIGADPEGRLEVAREIIKELAARLLYRLQGRA